MIKSSLHDIRQKLDVMRKNKEEIQKNVTEYEQRLMGGTQDESNLNY
jgi:hypothetical protein